MQSLTSYQKKVMRSLIDDVECISKLIRLRDIETHKIHNLAQLRQKRVERKVALQELINFLRKTD